MRGLTSGVRGEGMTPYARAGTIMVTEAAGGRSARPPARISDSVVAGGSGSTAEATLLPPLRVEREEGTWLKGDGGEGQNRTDDTQIFSLVLYQLSYLATDVGQLKKDEYTMRVRP
jgi:hypothetical protein